MPDTRGRSLPFSSTRMAAGTLNQALAHCHAGGHVGAAHPGGESPQRPVGAGMAVGADDAVTGGDDALLRQKGVLDAHIAHIKEVLNAELAGQNPGIFCSAGPP